MRELKTTALQVREDAESPSAAIRLPAETPPVASEPPIEEVDPPPVAEQISKEELVVAEAKKIPPPKEVFECAPMLKPSLVAPVQIDGQMFLEFLDALSCIARESGGVPILGNVRMTYREGELVLEATDNRVWAVAKLKAAGGTDGFECVLPLRRARNIVKRLVAHYPMVAIGVDLESIHIGSYSFPHGGSIREFPPRMTLHADELTAALPAHYVDAIIERVVPAIDEDHDRLSLRGIHFDFNHGIALGSDGSRLHLLTLGELQIDTKGSYKALPSVTLPLEVFWFLQAVIDREWVPLAVSAERVTSVGRDFGVMVRPLKEAYPDWRRLIPTYSGCWILDKEALLEALSDAHPLQASYVKIAVDSIREKLILTARNDRKETFQKEITARRKSGPPAVRCAIDPDYLRQAVEAIDGGLVRIGFDDEDAELRPITIRGEDDEFLAVVMPWRPSE